MKFALSAFVLAGCLGQAHAQSQYKELNGLSALNIGPTYTANFSHLAGQTFTDTLAFNIPAADLQGAVVNLSVGTGVNFGYLTGDLYKGIDPTWKPIASCMPSCSGEGYTFVSHLGGNASTWTSSLVTISQPGYYFVNIAGNTQIPNSTGGDYSGSITLSITPVPEASGWMMLMAGLGVVGMVSRRRLQPAA